MVWQNHWTERGRAGSVSNSDITGRPLRSVLAASHVMRTALKVIKFIVALALFGFGAVIVVGFLATWLSGELEEPLWQHGLAVVFMGVLPIVGGVLLLLIKGRPPVEPHP